MNKNICEGMNIEVNKTWPAVSLSKELQLFVIYYSYYFAQP